MAISTNDDGGTTIQILLTVPSLLHPKLNELKVSVREASEAEIHEFFASKGRDSSKISVNVEAIASSQSLPFMARLLDDHEEFLNELGPGLCSVTHAVAVYSCKGGVGKSTVAVNMAYEMARRGGRVGLLDLDIYGPSLPVMVRPKDITVRSSPKGSGMVYPIEHEGVKLLSLGFVSRKSGVPGSGKDNGAAIMRGPLAIKVVAQL